MATEVFSNHGCNDFELDSTPENLEFARDMISASDYSEDKPRISKDGMKIYSMDVLVMRYCADLLERRDE